MEEGLNAEVKYTKQMEKDLMKSVKDNIEEQHNVINTEKSERTQRLQDIFDMLDQDFQLQNKYFDKFEERMRNEFEKFCEHMEGEVDNRLDNQDDMLKKLSTFIDRFQDTLKVIGKDV